MTRLGLTCPLYITQNDGTLTTAAEAARLPIRTFSSGATNSMRGASYLAGIDLKKKDGTGKSMLVADVGGTTTDVGMLLPSGFPRQAAAFIEVGGVRTNFAMPDVNSIGLGGGSRVRVEGAKVTVGPDSVGHYLTRHAKVFGGGILTATDIAVRAGERGIGDSTLVSQVEDEVVGKVQVAMKKLLESVVDRMKTTPEDCTLLLVGGGSVIAPATLKGVGEIMFSMRTVTTQMGSAAALCPPPINVGDARDYGVPGTQSQAWRIGRAIASYRQKNDLRRVPHEILKLQNGKLMFIGKVVDVSREVRAGFTWGEVKIARLQDDELEDASGQTTDFGCDADDHVVIPFQNENLCAYFEKPDGTRTVAAVVPDLIVVLDSQSGSHLGTQTYSYGLRVTVIVMAGSPLWQTEQGLKMGGAEAFGSVP
ncbi:hypothetical protein CPB85DRAFT_1432322 [Mucidula mucida]|nr:hypothetical protein CPB85DRAFT_1432322 [Mucidula mucida]